MSYFLTYFSGAFLKQVQQHGQRRIMFLAMTETVAQNQRHANKVNVMGPVLHATVIVNHAMAETALYTLVMDMWQANVLVK